MQEFNLTIDYSPGTAMAHVDALSRNPIPESPKKACDILAVSESEYDWILTVQGADSEIQKIINILKDPNLDNIVDVKNNYKIKGDKLFKTTPHGERDGWYQRVFVGRSLSTMT